jgi:hypothetical protein
VRKLLVISGLAFLTCLSASAQTQQPVRVNCGGAGYTDPNGNVWQADFDYNTGTAGGNSSITVTGTTNPKLFQSNRWNGSTSTPLTYTFPVANGSYTVNLYFAETSGPEEAVGARVFNISLQGTPFLQNFDIFSQAGGANKAVVKSTSANVTNGSLAIQFSNVTQNALVNGIEIIPATTPTSPTLTLNFKYPDGTPVTGTVGYNVTSSLLSFQGTNPLVNGQAQCVLFANPSSMGLSAQFTVNLNLTDSTGKILWQLTLAMNPAQVNFGVIQSSTLNVVVQKT